MMRFWQKDLSDSRHCNWWENVLKLEFCYLLMFEPSFSRSPTAPVLTARSDPARSTREILLTFSPLTPLTRSVNVWVRMTVKTACDLEDSLFMLVEATVRLLLPSIIRSSISCKTSKISNLKTFDFLNPIYLIWNHCQLRKAVDVGPKYRMLSDFKSLSGGGGGVQEIVNSFVVNFHVRNLDLGLPFSSFALALKI